MEIKLVSWNESVIGQVENFLLSRYPITRLRARSVATVIVSIAIHGAVLMDDWGPVRANLFYLHIGESGFGFKTPIIRFLRRFFRAYNANYLAPSKFSLEGMAEYIKGVAKTTKRKACEAHRVNIIVRDEVTRLLGDIYTKKHNKNMMEFVSELWDGWIEGYYTRGFQEEGNIDVYCSVFFAGSHYFYELLQESFFTQGLGNRFLWIIEDIKAPEKLKGDFFFGSNKDPEEEKLFKQIIPKLKYLETLRVAMPINDTEKKWITHQYDMALQAFEQKGLAGTLKKKIALNTLKLAMCYSASRMSIDRGNSILMVRDDDVDIAIKTMKQHEEMWAKAMDEWQTRKSTYSTRSHLNDFDRIRYLIDKYHGMLPRSKIQPATGWKLKPMDELINSMYHAEQIKVLYVKSKTKTKTVYVHFNDEKFKNYTSGAIYE